MHSWQTTTSPCRLWGMNWCLRRPKRRSTPEWEKEFAGITAYRQDCHRAHCSYCQTNFIVAHGGRHDVVKHVGTPTHTRTYDDAKRSGRQASYALARLNTFNLLFQREGCGIYHLLGETKALLCTYLSRFVDSDILSSADDLLTIDFEDQMLQVDNNTLDIGTAARRFILSIEEECESAPIQRFYENVRQGYVAVVKGYWSVFRSKVKY